MKANFETNLEKILINAEQLSKLQDLDIEEVYSECLKSTQKCIELSNEYNKIIEELTDIESLKFQLGGLGVFAYGLYVCTGYKWNLGRKYKKVNSELEKAQEIDAVNWDIYSQMKSQERCDKEIEMVKE